MNQTGNLEDPRDLKMNSTNSEFLTVSDLATILRCDEETISSRIINGDLPGVKFGRGWIIPRQALIERLNEKAQQESTDRRSLHERIQNRNTKYSNEVKNLNENNGKRTVLSDTLPTTKHPRRRREPPELPKIF